MRKNHAVQKIAVILLMLCICMSAQATEVVSAQLTTRAGGTNGMVRVFLSSMGNPSTLTLTPVGSYSVNGNVSQTLTSGESVTVRFNSSTGNLTLTRGGTTSDMGSSFALRRHSTSGTNGIKIAQARKPGNPYPGDLSFQAVRQSSGSYKLYTIAHIYIESYLYGVLPYEMGNGAHLEALKAQAVAARTYTLRMMNNRSSGYYDVVDTTNDQVYNGTPSGNASCVSAVDATKGIVLMYGSSLTATYYSASNGGQTESAQHVWGGSGYPYLTVKDDPFDYENAQSSVKSTTVYADGTSASQNSSLMSLLEGKAVTALNAMGYRATTSNTSIQTISAVTPHTPKYDSPSRLYTKMDFQLTARTVDGYGSTATPSITVTCDIFSELESRLGMSLQSAKNELWSVKTSGSNFVLQARRYGHGAGLSQRGAMQMGRLGYTYDQILGFYFTGCARVQYNFSHTILSSVESGGTQTETTVEDAAELTGTDGCTGVVKLDGTSGVLAVRTEKSASSSLAGVAPASAPVTVLASDGSWCFIRYGGVKGYVPAGAITVTGTPAATTAEQPSSIIGFGTVKANGYLNLRQSGSSSAAVLTTAPTGSVLTVFSSSGGWAQVQYGATVAYASSDFLSLSSAYPGTVADSGQAGSGGGDTTLAPGETLAIVACEGEALSVFDQQSQSGNVVQQIAKGQSVVVTNRGAQWCAVRYEGATGYVLTAQLTFPSDTQTGESISAVVATESGSLNMRMEGRAGSPILTTIPKGAQVSVTQKGAEWSAVRYAGYSGYVMTRFLQFSGDSAGDVTQVGDASAVVTTASGSLNLRAEGKTGSQILRTIPRLATITVHQKGAEWCAVTYEGTTGYVMTVFLTFTQTQTSPAPSETVSPSSSPSAAPDASPSASVTPSASPEASASPSASVEPSVTPSVMPSPTLSPAQTPAAQLVAVVTTASGSLNLRQDPLPGSRILTQIPRGTSLVVSERLATWSLVTYAGNDGYVMNAFLTFSQGEAPTPAPTQSVQEGQEFTSAYVNTPSGSLNLRSEASLSCKVLTTIPRGAAIQVFAQGDVWCQVQYNGVLGYAQSKYLTLENASSTVVAPTPSPMEGGTASSGGTTAWVLTPSGSLNLRESAGGKVIGVIPRLAQVTLYAAQAQWSRISYQGTEGYVASEYLTDQNPLGTANTSANQTQAAPAPAPTLDPTLQYVTEELLVKVMCDAGENALPMYAMCDLEAQVVKEVPDGQTVSVIQRGDNWCLVAYEQEIGYCETMMLIFP